MDRRCTWPEALHAIVSPLVIRSQPEIRSAYSAYRDELRYDFYYSCAYCSISEIEAHAIGFQIDHYKPQTTNDPDVNAYNNLMWSCSHCNSSGSKGDFWPTEAHYLAGIRLVRPDVDSLYDHYELSGDEIVGKSVPGNTTIAILRLNRRTLTRLRSARNRLYQSKRAIIGGIQALQDISLDQCAPELRQKLIEIRKAIGAQQTQLQTALDNCTVRYFNHSPNIDRDPDAAAHVAGRKKYLASIKAMVP